MNSNRLHSGYSHSLLREWQKEHSYSLLSSFMYPLFISDNPDAMELIPTLPNQYRIGKDRLIEYLSSFINRGLQSVLLFGTISQGKDERASMADDITNPVMQVIPLLKNSYPQLYIACDLCLCAYTSHGHCGLLNENGIINNEASLERLAEVALKYSQQGCHMIAPSDMMDGRVYSIKQILRKNALDGVIAIMSYSAKFASCFYGPFRNAAQSAPAFGDRKCYQLPSGSRGLAMKAIDRDISEGADIVMIKPGMPYLDIIREAKLRHPETPLAVYHVSGEYSSLVYASEAGVFELKKAVMECIDAFHRAGFWFEFICVVINMVQNQSIKGRNVFSTHTDSLKLITISQSSSTPSSSINLLNRTWTMYRVSSFHQFAHHDSDLKGYEESLNNTLKREIEQSLKDSWMEEEEKDDEEEEKIAKAGSTLEYFHIADKEDSEGIRITIKYTEKNTKKENLLYAIFLSTGEGNANKENGNGMKNEKDDGSNFTHFPILLLRGPVKLSHILIDWVESQFDCRIALLKLQPLELLLLFSRWSSVFADIETNKPLELTYYFPTNVSELKEVVLTISNDNMKRLVESVLLKVDENRALTDMNPLMEALEVHFFHHFHIHLPALSLVRVGNSLAYVGHEGKIKLFEVPLRYTFQILQYLITLAKETFVY